jgi:hypothetical protein
MTQADMYGDYHDIMYSGVTTVTDAKVSWLQSPKKIQRTQLSTTTGKRCWV